MSPAERYLRDPRFAAIVNMCLAQLGQCEMTGTELREAVILAAQMHESTRVRRWCADGGDLPQDALNNIRNGNSEWMGK